MSGISIRSVEYSGSTSRDLYIAVCGQAGTGKTTLVPLIAHKMELPALLESIAMLPAYTAWLEGNGSLLEAQQQFLERAFRLQLIASKGGGVQERPIYENYEVVVLYYHSKGLLTDAELGTLGLRYQGMCGEVREPDLLVHLTAPTEVLVARRQRRGKRHDIHVKAEEIRDIQGCYDAMLKSWRKSPVISIDTSAQSPEVTVEAIISKAREISRGSRE